MMRLLIVACALFAAPAHALEWDVADFECLAKNVYFEARGEPVGGKVAVIFATLNRVKSPRFPDNICDVVLQPRQFSWTHDGKSDNVDWSDPIEVEAWKDIKMLTAIILLLREHITDPTGGADHYHSVRVDPPWAKKMKQTAQYGEHVFYAR